LQDLELTKVKTESRVPDIVAGDDDDEMIQLIRTKSTSVAQEASKLPPPPPSEAASGSEEAEVPAQEPDKPLYHPLEEDKETAPTSDAPIVRNSNNRIRKTDATRPNRVSQEAFNKGLRPTKSVLKRHNHPIVRASSTYESTTATSPTPSSPTSISSNKENNFNEVSMTPTRVQRASIGEKRKCCVVM
jgi:hypothetical protein